MNACKPKVSADSLFFFFRGIILLEPRFYDKALSLMIIARRDNMDECCCKIMTMDQLVLMRSQSDGRHPRQDSSPGSLASMRSKKERRDRAREGSGI